MKIAVLSDIHGNRQALEAVLEAVQGSSCEELWCLGDLVGYGADPDACVEMISQHAAVCLAGNHDLGVCGALALEQFSKGAALAARWTQNTIAPETLAFLQALKPSSDDEVVGLFHGSPRDPVWEYVLSPLQAELCLDAQSRRVSLIGHSHVALSFCRAPEAATTGQTRTDGEVLDLVQGEWLINPGSVGQPRDGDSRAAWLELDTTDHSATFHRLEYDVQGAAAAIRAAGLPDSLAERLFFGQ